MSHGEVRWRWWYYSVVLFKTLSVISFEELVALYWPLNHIPKIHIWLCGFHFSSSMSLQFYHIIYHISSAVYFLRPCVITSFILYSPPFIFYHRCSWKVCRRRSLQSSWWGSCTERWSVRRSIPPLQVWTGSWRQIPGNAGLGVWMHMDGTPGNLTTTWKKRTNIGKGTGER